MQRSDDSARCGDPLRRFGQLPRKSVRQAGRETDKSQKPVYQMAAQLFMQFVTIEGYDT
jgi:hypothetical protein